MTDIKNLRTKYSHKLSLSPEGAETFVNELARKRPLSDEVQRILRDALSYGHLVEDAVEISLTFVAPGGKSVKFQLPLEEVGLQQSTLIH